MAYKFNSGYGAIICDKCRIVLKVGLGPKEYDDLCQQDLHTDTCENYGRKCKNEISKRIKERLNRKQ